MRCYLVEAKWFIEGYLPSFEEYLKNGLVTSTSCYLPLCALLGMGSVRKEDFEWLSKRPELLVAVLKIGRLVDDVATYEV